jgi:hypothetical protein
VPDAPTEPGLTIAYHGTKQLSAVLADGLRCSPWPGYGCPFGHVCLTDLPEIAAALALGPNGGIVAVDLTQLDLPSEGFVGHEMRLHNDVPASALTRYTEPVTSSMEKHVDPALVYERGQHPTCLRLIDQGRAEGWLGPPGTGPPKVPRPVGP